MLRDTYRELTHRTAANDAALVALAADIDVRLHAQFEAAYEEHKNIQAIANEAALRKGYTNWNAMYRVMEPNAFVRGVNDLVVPQTPATRMDIDEEYASCGADLHALGYGSSSVWQANATEEKNYLLPDSEWQTRAQRTTDAARVLYETFTTSATTRMDEDYVELSSSSDEVL